MGASLSSSLPVLVSFEPQAARQDAWGRLVELSPAAAKISLLAALKKAERVFLSFEITGEGFKACPAQVTYVEQDSDGFYEAELRFSDEIERRRLSRVLVDMFSRQ